MCTISKFSGSLIFLLIPLLVSSYAFGQQKPQIILDTDMAGDCDDAGALAILHALSDKEEAEILAVVTNRKDISNASAAAVDVINTYYGHPDIPIGTDKDGIHINQRNPSSFTGALRDNFLHNASADDQMPDALDVYRKTLAASKENSVTICSVGALSNLEDLVRSGPDQYSDLTGRQLIHKKVKELVVMGGEFPRSSKPETNIRLDPAAAVTVTNQWPGPILWQGFEIGSALYIGEELKNTPERNPVRRAYELRPFRGRYAIDRGKPSHDQAAVLLAVRGPQPEYWRISPPGYVSVNSEGHTEWHRRENGKHRYVRLIAHPSEVEEIIGRLMTRQPNEH